MIKLLDILREDNKILTTRRTPEERQKNYNIARDKQKALIQKKIADYAKDPSGNLELKELDFNITLPDNLYVHGNLDLYGTEIEQLPKGLKIMGSLILRFCKKLKEIPEDIEIIHDLEMEYTSLIRTLPDNLTVHTLWAFRSNLQSLPNNLTTREDIWANNTFLKDIGKNLKVHGDLRIRQTPISKEFEPEDILIGIKHNGGFVKGQIIGGGS